MDTEPQLEGAKNSEREELLEALENLNEAAKRSREDVVALIREDFKELRGIFEELRPEVVSSVREIGLYAGKAVHDARDNIEEVASQAAQRADHEVHAKPWTYIGIAALGGLLIGAFSARKRN